MLALAAYEGGVCDCGLHESVAQDKTNHFAIADKKCPVCARLAVYGRVIADRDERGQPQDVDPAAAHPADGRRLMLRPMSSAEVDEAKAKKRKRQSASSTASVSNT